MTFLLDFTMKYRSDDEQKRFLSAPKSYNIKTLSNFVPQIKKGV